MGWGRMNPICERTEGEATELGADHGRVSHMSMRPEPP